MELQAQAGQGHQIDDLSILLATHIVKNLLHNPLNRGGGVRKRTLPNTVTTRIIYRSCIVCTNVDHMAKYLKQMKYCSFKTD